MRKGKLVYRPPERCYTNVFIEENEHGYRVFRHKGDDRPFTFIPHSSVKEVLYQGSE